MKILLFCSDIKFTIFDLWNLTESMPSSSGQLICKSELKFFAFAIAL